MKIRLTTLLLLSIISLPSLAVSVNASKQGSSIIAYATNDSDKLAKCSYNGSVNYVQYGNAGSQNINGMFDVPPHANNVVVYNWPTPWAASTLTLVSFNYNCS